MRRRKTLQPFPVAFRVIERACLGKAPHMLDGFERVLEYTFNRARIITERV